MKNTNEIPGYIEIYWKPIATSLTFLSFITVFGFPQPAAAFELYLTQPLRFESEKIASFEGEASYYSRVGCLGCDSERIMANGQALNDARYTIAVDINRRHFVNHMARVTNTETGESVRVAITDVGGFDNATYNYRVADLSVATKQAINLPSTGQVTIEVFGW